MQQLTLWYARWLVCANRTQRVCKKWILSKGRRSQFKGIQVIVSGLSNGSQEHRCRDVPDEFQGKWSKAGTVSSGKHALGTGKAAIALLQHQGGLIQAPALL